jgi:LmbE family N-acetylglucosaminyl deacetylase
MPTLTQEPPLKLPFRILAIAAHPDDLEFGMAGSVAVWTDQGAEVIYCIVTDGSAGSNDPDTDLEDLIERRKQEQLRAAELVGVKEVRFLDYQDGILQPTLELRRDLTRLIRELKPDRVVLQDPTLIFAGDFYINHPDHRAAAEAAIYAVFPSAETRPIFPELLAEGLEPHKVAELYLGFSTDPKVFVDTTPAVDRKIQSLLCHSSQVGEEVQEMVKKWDAETGAQVGVGFAETFRVMYLNRDPMAEMETPEATVVQNA